MRRSLIIFLVCIFSFLALLISAKYGAGLPRPYSSRNCEGRGWRRAFPTASKNEIRSFLLLFVSAFAFSDKDKLKFRPDDKILDIYRNLYSSEWLPDALELETLASKLQKQYTLELESIWSDELTLGELFNRTQA
jgi:propanediol dehydratase small subunit